MKLPNPFSKTPPHEVRVARPTFVSEQEGDAERALKEELSNVFRTQQKLRSAYLARVHYGNPSITSVCLCLKTESDVRKSIVDAIGSVFAKTFRQGTHLDIIFLEREQESELAKVCKPFYQREWNVQ